MTGEINNLGTALPTTVQVRASTTGELLRLLQPQQPALLAPGETAKAEVLALRQVGQDFQLLLKLTQDSGKQTNVQASSSQPLAQGSLLAVSQTSTSNLAITMQQAIASSVASLTRIDTREMPIGTLLQGKVLTSQALPQAGGQLAQFRSLVTLLGGSQAGTTLTIDSPRPLAVGSLLSARVQGDQSLSFVPLSGRQEQLAIAQHLSSQQSRQASLQGLLSQLQQMRDSIASNEIRSNVDKLLNTLPDIRQLSDPKGLAQALSNSGVFLEAKLLAGLPASLAPDLKAQVVRLVAQMLPGLPGNAQFNPGAAASTLAQVMPGMVRNALGMLGQVSPRPQPGGFPLPSRQLQSQQGEGDLEHLLRLAAAAISRLQSHQLASLEQTGTTADGNLQTTWQLEIPVRSGQDFMPVQMKLQREETPEQQSDPERERRDPLEMLWRIELAFDLHPLGPVQIQAHISQGTLSSQLWAEFPCTAQLIDSQLGNLRERLLARGLNVTELQCHHGTPPQGPRTRLEQRWVDETA